jgi:hypothetical protein
VEEKKNFIVRQHPKNDDEDESDVEREKGKNH